MDKFLETYNPPEQNHKEIEKLNRPIMSKETEKAKPPNKERLGPEGFTGEFYQTLKEELIPIFLKLSQKS